LSSSDKKAAASAAKIAYETIDEKLGADITILDISDVSIMADYFIIASANNLNHLKALADETERKLFEAGFKMRHSEGYNTSKWILLDYSSIIVHLFTKEEREFYNIERVWGDSQTVDPVTL